MRLSLPRFVAASSLVHLLALASLALLTHQIATLPDRPLRIRIVDVPRPAVDEPPRSAEAPVAPWQSRAHRPSKREGPPASPRVSGTPELSPPGPAPMPAAPPRPEVPGTAAPGPVVPTPTPAAPPAPLASPGPTTSTSSPEGSTATAPAPGPPSGKPSSPADGRGRGPAVARPSLRDQVASLGRAWEAAKPGVTELQEEGDTGSAKERTVSLDSRDYRYASYLLGVKRRIENVWGYPAEARAMGLTGSLLVVFTIERDGRLGSLELLEGSGARVLDDEAVEAVRRAAPYAPFPERMAFDRLRIRASFNYLSGFSLLRGSGGAGRP